MKIVLLRFFVRALTVFNLKKALTPRPKIELVC
jgi:hypothetical protein